jgi:2-C-methyl-D-erythritol 2,4-cyclodiphosphate synthase
LLAGAKAETIHSRNAKIISSITGVSENDVSIKATTTEEMGFIGKGKGIMAYATVLLQKV